MYKAQKLFFNKTIKDSTIVSALYQNVTRHYSEQISAHIECARFLKLQSRLNFLD